MEQMSPIASPPIAIQDVPEVVVLRDGIDKIFMSQRSRNFTSKKVQKLQIHSSNGQLTTPLAHYKFRSLTWGPGHNSNWRWSHHKATGVDRSTNRRASSSDHCYYDRARLPATQCCNGE
jgi:hypothetical protein